MPKSPPRERPICSRVRGSRARSNHVKRRLPRGSKLPRCGPTIRTFSTNSVSVTQVAVVATLWSTPRLRSITSSAHYRSYARRIALAARRSSRLWATRTRLCPALQRLIYSRPSIARKGQRQFSGGWEQRMNGLVKNTIPAMPGVSCQRKNTLQNGKRRLSITSARFWSGLGIRIPFGAPLRGPGVTDLEEDRRRLSPQLQNRRTHRSGGVSDHGVEAVVSSYARAVKLGAERYAVRRTPKRGLRQVDFTFDGNEISRTRAESANKIPVGADGPFREKGDAVPQ
jgi:hypothetical protein